LVIFPDQAPDRKNCRFRGARGGRQQTHAWRANKMLVFPVLLGYLILRLFMADSGGEDLL
jgi:hypothetical protein